MKTIRWGILGAGDVAEVKSGPAFREAPGSELVAVMRRDGAKAQDFARRHEARRWYDDAAALIADEEVDAIYVATPPSSHADYTVAALAAGKFVYVEKPMSTDIAGCDAMIAANESVGGNRLVVAHYRRALPLFEAVDGLLRKGAIGRPALVDIRLDQRAVEGKKANPAENWRIDAAISGGGLFHDLAPHQIDLIIHWFGEPKKIRGTSEADGRVSGTFETPAGIEVRGRWDFQSSESVEECRIEGNAGSLRFSFFGQPRLEIDRGEGREIREFEHPRTVQRGMIERTNRFFRGEGPNPCPPGEARTGMVVIESFAI